MLVWIAILLPLVGAAESHTWTDTTGRTLNGEFVEANAQEVTVRLENGQTVKIPRTMLSAADLDYADKAQANRPIKVSIETSRAVFSTKTSNTQQLQTVNDSTGYNVTISNLSLIPGQNLKVEYQIFYRKGVHGKTISSQPQMHQGGSEAIDKIEAQGKKNFRTSTVAIAKQTPRSVMSSSGNTMITYTWPNGGQETVSDQIDGVWVRVIQNEKVISEYVSSDSLAKAGWPDDGGSAPAAAKKKAPAKPAPAAN